MVQTVRNSKPIDHSKSDQPHEGFRLACGQWSPARHQTCQCVYSSLDSTVLGEASPLDIEGEPFASLTLMMSDPGLCQRPVGVPVPLGESPVSDGRESSACSLLSASTALDAYCWTTGDGDLDDTALLIAAFA